MLLPAQTNQNPTVPPPPAADSSTIRLKLIVNTDSTIRGYVTDEIKKMKDVTIVADHEDVLLLINCSGRLVEGRGMVWAISYVVTLQAYNQGAKEILQSSKDEALKQKLLPYLNNKGILFDQFVYLSLSEADLKKDISDTFDSMIKGDIEAGREKR